MIPQKFSGRLRVLDEHYKTAFEDPFQVAPEKRYGQLKVPKLKLCKCAVASIVNLPKNIHEDGFLDKLLIGPIKETMVSKVYFAIWMKILISPKVATNFFVF